jgi:hypothetical protein
MSRLYTQIINGTDCIGDSRISINLGFGHLDDAVQELSGSNIGNFITNTTQITSLSSRVLTTNTFLSTEISTLSSSLNQVRTSFNTVNVGPSATTTTFVNVLSVFTSAGSYIGFIPIYQ